MRAKITLFVLALSACGEPREGPPPEAVSDPGAAVEPADPSPEPESSSHAAADPADPPPEVAAPYDDNADAQADIDGAIASSRTDGKRVLLMFGANWCPWCRRLEHTFRNAAEVSAELSEGYHLVHVDVGARESDTNRDVARRYGDPIAQGLPCLVVLEPDGTVAHVQETGSLEAGDRHDPARVLAFLRRWRSDS